MEAGLQAAFLMIDESPTTPLVVRLATPEDIPLITLLDSLSLSPTRDIHRDMEKYFGSVDPSTHERILIFLGEVDGVAAAKAELMLPPPDERSTPRSEEHTSELQSQSNLVCRLLLEKKKNTNTHTVD